MEPPPAPRRTLSSKRASTIQPLDVRRILTDSHAAEAKPLPAEHVASPASPTASMHSMSSDRMAFQSHSRTMSTVAVDYIGGGTPIRTNRFSMTFPIQPATREQSPHRPSSSSSPTKDAVPVVSETAVASPTGPTDSNFLTAIAAQERRVLELKEELQRAEAELDKLKRQWANHEAHKKKNDARKVTKLQPLNTTLASPKIDEDGDGSSAWMQQEMERRKALLNGTRTSNRTVFSGSRHARALSLLSPVHKSGSGNFTAPHPPRQDSLASKKKQSLESERSRAQQQQRPSMLSRASTTPDMTTEVAETASAEIDLNNVDRDVLIKTGKKMASDFKDGLWTFLEDLRQATVGDEATQVLPNGNVNGNHAVRKQASTQTLRKGVKHTSSRTSLRPSSRGSTASKASTSTETTKRPPTANQRRQSPAKMPEEPPLVDAFWTEAGLSVPHESTAPVKRASKHTKTPSTAPSVASSIDAWDTWDDNCNSPKDSRSSSATSESVTHHIGSPRTSKEGLCDDAVRGGGSSDKKDPIPWPALAKFGPATLRRTASHLMNEWEKSLAPSPGREYKGEGVDYMGLNAEARALVSGSGKRD